MKKELFLLCLLLFGLPFSMLGQVTNEHDDQSRTDVDSLSSMRDFLSVPLTMPSPQPLFLMTAPGFDGCSPWFMNTYGPSWNLHKGFNAQLSMSITAGLGKHAPSGVGFGQSVAFAYAVPLIDRFSIAAGLYAQNMDWGPYRQTDVGISAVVGFKVNDAVTLYGYGSKSLLPDRNRHPMGYFPLFLEDVKDRIGAMAEFKIGENAKIGISIERTTVRVPEYRTANPPVSIR